jgi:hypothetical protein
MAYPRSLADFVFETLPEVLMATLPDKASAALAYEQRPMKDWIKPPPVQRRDSGHSRPLHSTNKRPIRRLTVPH